MATKILMPKLSDTMTEGVILKWLRKEGDKIKQGEILVEIESDKADMELEAYDSGIVRKIFIPEGKSAAIGAPIAIIGELQEDISSLLSTTPPEEMTIRESTPTSDRAPESSHPSMEVTRERSDRLKASPLARRLAKDHQIELHSLSGSGPQGRVIKRDIEPLLRGVPPTPVGTLKPSAPGGYTDKELSLIRKTIAKRLQESKQTIPHFYVTIEINMEPAIAFREQVSTAADVKLGFTDLLVKASARVLLRFPAVNASFINGVMRQYSEAHIAVAVALDDGLVTPVVRNCERKTIHQIHSELQGFIERARSRKLKPEEYQGATFTISNLGMYGVDNFTAIINPPEAAILSVGAIVEKPVVQNNQISIGHTMKCTLASDHRIIDGAVAAQFLQDLKKSIENPAGILL